MTLTDDEFALIMASAKVISGDITWKWRDGGSPALYFRVAVEAAVSSDLFCAGPLQTCAARPDVRIDL